LDLCRLQVAENATLKDGLEIFNVTNKVKLGNV
jgi:hypothetical protein